MNKRYEVTLQRDGIVAIIGPLNAMSEQIAIGQAREAMLSPQWDVVKVTELIGGTHA